MAKVYGAPRVSIQIMAFINGFPPRSTATVPAQCVVQLTATMSSTGTSRFSIT